MKKLFPLILALIGLGLGIGAGVFLRPAPAVEDNAEIAEAAPAEPPEYVKLSNQFVIPVVEDGQVAALVVVSLSLEVTTGSTETVFAREPKLRDVFLQVLFDHANAGGFRGSFTDGSNLVVLRQALKEVAMQVLGDIITDVLIVDIARQDS
jgi:flagellar protein FliL